MRFLLIDRIVRLGDGAGFFLKNVSQAEDYFEHHFPGNPIMPGALILESFEQGAQLLIARRHDFACHPELQAVVKAAFRHFVIPGDQLEISISLSEVGSGRASAMAKARVRGKLMAEATLEFKLVPASSSAEARKRCRRLKETHHLLSSDPVSRAWETMGHGRTDP